MVGSSKVVVVKMREVSTQTQGARWQRKHISEDMTVVRKVRKCICHSTVCSGASICLTILFQNALSPEALHGSYDLVGGYSTSHQLGTTHSN